MLSSSLAMEAACLVRGTGRNTGVDILQEAKIQNGSSLTSFESSNDPVRTVLIWTGFVEDEE